MKLLIIGPQYETLDGVRNFSGVWAYYLTRELRRMGVELSFVDQVHKNGWSDIKMLRWHRDLDLSNVDHVLALGTRYFDRVPKDCGHSLQRALRRKGRGWVGQIHDGPTRRSPCDVTFHIKANMKFPSSSASNDNWHIGWGADPQTFAMAQAPGVIRILVDHAQLEGGEPEDYTQTIIEQCQAFAREQRYEFPVIIRHIVDGGVITIDPGKPYKSELYRRETIPFEQILKEYCYANVFMVTHPESVGYTVLETAMCGALPVVPQGAVSTKLLATVRHIRYPNLRVPWNDVVNMLNPELSRAKAIDNDWASVAGKIMEYYERWDD